MEKKIFDLYNHDAHGPGSYTDSVRVGSTIYLGGQCGYDPATLLPVSADFEEQAVQTFRNIEAILKGHGADCEALVAMTVHFSDHQHYPIFQRVRQRFMHKTAVAGMGYVTKIVWPEFLLEVTAIADVG